jgi:hypothetical protein
MKRTALTLLTLASLALAACGDDADPATEVETVKPVDTGVDEGRADAFSPPGVSKPRPDASVPPIGGGEPPPTGGDSPRPTGGDSSRPPPAATSPRRRPRPRRPTRACPRPTPRSNLRRRTCPPETRPATWAGSARAAPATPTALTRAATVSARRTVSPTVPAARTATSSARIRPGASATFCVEGPVVGSGACVQQCDYAAFPTGCRPGYGCRLTPRYNQPDVERQVCLPGAGDPPGENPCADELNRRGLSYIVADNPNDHPADNPALTCDLVGPLLLRSPVGDVDYRYVESAEPSPMFMGCELAIALDDLSAYLRELDVVELVHIGTYNCRVIAGSDSISMHGLGLAIDIHELRTSDGTTYNVEDDWEPGDDPQTPKGRLLYEFGMQMFTRGIFNIVLTPNYNDAHYNHFHVDLTPGGNFIGRGIDPHRGVFPNVSGD